MIALAVFVGIIAPAIAFVASPGTMYDGGTPSWLFVVPLLGGVGVIVGLVWMVRIHRSDPEPDQRAWRYRAER